MPSDSLAFRLLLAIVSILTYAVLVQFAPLIEAIDGVPHLNTAFHLVVGAIFGAFIMGPYARGPRRNLRGLMLAVAAGAIYYAAIRFVVDGPASLDALASFVIAGSSAALLCGLAVALIAPRAFSRCAALLLFVAGAAGGASFALKVTFDPDLVIGHAVWQLLTCLALYLGQPRRPT